ncbi:Type 1 glutamine amidotransferase-like domain-containing protein [Microbacterium sp. NPDC077663]|uniref:Type 1 glutamine amidotransferase-like domain-containing protein n=1 Tax=Microbacterium sp. NPDC077663 TaxID=3364189 RepID=UPI0037C5D6B7
MRVHLIGGGRDDTHIVPLLAAGLAGARRVRILLVIEADDEESVPRWRRLGELAGVADPDVVSVVEGERFTARILEGVDAVVVGGGLTPTYAHAFANVAPHVRERVAGGMPYIGFSAGSAIAASSALVGGWRLDGVPVANEDAGEEEDELLIVPGLGLVPFAVDVHAAQWGTLTRLTAAVAAGLVPRGYAVDEHTALVVTDPGSNPTVAGVGAAWHVAPDGRSAVVTRLTARG